MPSQPYSVAIAPADVLSLVDARPLDTIPGGTLVGIFPGFRDLRTLRARLLLTLIGFLPVTLIAISTFDVIGLRAMATRVLTPAAFIAVFLIGRHRWAWRLVPSAMLVGALATGGYDLVRLGFYWRGWLHVDPIPHIGTALRLRPAWLYGYMWRYGGNGAGLSVAFFGLGFSRLREGLLFGLFVCCGLLAVLVISPAGQRVLFPLSVTTVIMATVGHLVYGAGLIGFARVCRLQSRLAKPVDGG
jgi:hypothetical protein